MTSFLVYDVVQNISAEAWCHIQKDFTHYLSHTFSAYYNTMFAIILSIAFNSKTFVCEKFNITQEYIVV